MEIESAAQGKLGVFGRCKALPGKAKDKIFDVGKSVKKLGKDDPRRVIHSLKVGLALTLVSLLYFWRPLYDGFGMSGMWAVLTVVVVFEFSVGATLGKGLNRGFATLLAGALGVGALHLSSLFGKEGEPVVLGILVFLLAAAATFTRFFPKIKARYDYGVLIFILTFSMISVSGYRVEELLEMAHQRLSTILIGGTTCIFVSMFVCPVWAGQDLHNLIASNIEKLANYLEGFGCEYFQASEDKDCIEALKNDKSFLNGYKSVLNTKGTEESLANFAKWEPGHGRFLFRHPWKQYLKIGVLVRQCAYQIEALNSHFTSDIQAPVEFIRVIEESCTKMSSESGKVLKSLASSIKAMKHPESANEHVENSKAAVKDLKTALEAAGMGDSDLLAIISAATVASILVEIVDCVEKISEAVHELSQMARFKKVENTVSPETKPKQMLLHRGSVKPVLDGDQRPDHVTITVLDTASIDSLENVNVKPQGPKKPIEEV
ncbi:aluminum-activated malate transporter 8 [Morus notabilis]|uniref:aluminum-activated malate transporter 8 n=1 Tax=Morus notabilis TaxID=981085 RepID=UPI000CED618A|nr:aluminum-activated malate transporter 8 [Morus notabilis]